MTKKTKVAPVAYDKPMLDRLYPVLQALALDDSATAHRFANLLLAFRNKIRFYQTKVREIGVPNSNAGIVGAYELTGEAAVWVLCKDEELSLPKVSADRTWIRVDFFMQKLIPAFLAEKDGNDLFDQFVSIFSGGDATGVKCPMHTIRCDGVDYISLNAVDAVIAETLEVLYQDMCDYIQQDVRYFSQRVGFFGGKRLDSGEKVQTTVYKMRKKLDELGGAEVTTAQKLEILGDFKASNHTINPFRLLMRHRDINAAYKGFNARINRAQRICKP
jgi:hypothetical protein